MSTVPYIDQSLARGLARQSARKIDTRIDRLVEKATRGDYTASTRPRPAQRLRENTRTLERKLGNLLVASFDALLDVHGQDEVEHARVFLAWDVRETDEGFSRISLGNINLSYRTGDRFLHRLGGVVISEHAMQRVYQRLRTLDQRKALAELGDAAATFWMHIIRAPYEFKPGQTCFVDTPHGLAYAEVDLERGLVTFITWIDESKLRPEQQAVRRPGTDAKTIGIRYYSGRKHVPAVGQFQRTPPTAASSQDSPR